MYEDFLCKPWHISSLDNFVAFFFSTVTTGTAEFGVRVIKHYLHIGINLKSKRIYTNKLQNKDFISFTLNVVNFSVSSATTYLTKSLLGWHY